MSCNTEESINHVTGLAADCLVNPVYAQHLQ